MGVPAPRRRTFSSALWKVSCKPFISAVFCVGEVYASRYTCALLLAAT